MTCAAPLSPLCGREATVFCFACRAALCERHVVRDGESGKPFCSYRCVADYGRRRQNEIRRIREERDAT